MMHIDYLYKLLKFFDWYLMTIHFFTSSRGRKGLSLTFEDQTIMGEPMSLLCPCRISLIFSRHNLIDEQVFHPLDVQFVNQEKILFFLNLSSEFIHRIICGFFCFVGVLIMFKSSIYTTIMTNPLFACFMKTH